MWIPGRYSSVFQTADIVCKLPTEDGRYHSIAGMQVSGCGSGIAETDHV